MLGDVGDIRVAGDEVVTTVRDLVDRRLTTERRYTG